MTSAPRDRPWWLRLDGVPPGGLQPYRPPSDRAPWYRLGKGSPIALSLGIGYGVTAVPGGAIAIGGVATFLWLLGVGIPMPATLSEAKKWSEGKPAGAYFAGRALPIAWATRYLWLFAIGCLATAGLRLLLGHALNAQ